MGVEGLSMAICMDPDLVEAVFGKIGELHTASVKKLAKMDAVGVLRQGDDLGFKTSTLLAPEHLRAYVFPIYKQMVDAAHAAGKPFILHSCGNLADVYGDLIKDVGIDAKHSFEENITPVTEFKKEWGAKVTPLGGLDVDRICRDDEATLRRYVREVAEVCWADGYWSLGTGNSLTNYMPVEQYGVVVDEGRKIEQGL
jgi:uroporphyrinogen decarboxylase